MDDVMPIAPLMIEHRSIEKMIALMKKEAERVSGGGELDVAFIYTAVDFMRTYADRCHHGKEEDILFRALEEKQISPDLGKIMEDLTKEHVWGRETTKKLVSATKRYVGGEEESMVDILASLDKLVDFYPKHIDVEDNHFFIPVMEYFTDEEKVNLLGQMLKADAEMIHEKYRNVVKEAAARG